MKEKKEYVRASNAKDILFVVRGEYFSVLRIDIPHKIVLAEDKRGEPRMLDLEGGQFYFQKGNPEVKMLV